MLLSGHIECRSGDRILELGTGCGIIAMMLAFRFPEIHMVGVEIQKDLADLAKKNVQENGLSSRVRILQGDLRTIQPATIGGAADIVVSNPPYRKLQSGRLNPNLQKAVARHEIEASLSDVAAAASRTLKIGGRLLAIYPIERLVDMVCCFRDNGLEPKVVRTIHSREDAAGKLVVVTGVKDGRPGARIPPPLYIYRSNGAYTEEVERMFAAGATPVNS